MALIKKDEENLLNRRVNKTPVKVGKEALSAQATAMKESRGGLRPAKPMKQGAWDSQGNPIGGTGKGTFSTVSPNLSPTRNVMEKIANARDALGITDTQSQTRAMGERIWNANKEAPIIGGMVQTGKEIVSGLNQLDEVTGVNKATDSVIEALTPRAGQQEQTIAPQRNQWDEIKAGVPAVARGVASDVASLLPSMSELDPNRVTVGDRIGEAAQQGGLYQGAWQAGKEVAGAMGDTLAPVKSLLVGPWGNEKEKQAIIKDAQNTEQMLQTDRQDATRAKEASYAPGQRFDREYPEGSTRSGEARGGTRWTVPGTTGEMTSETMVPKDRQGGWVSGKQNTTSGGDFYGGTNVSNMTPGEYLRFKVQTDLNSAAMLKANRLNRREGGGGRTRGSSRSVVPGTAAAKRQREKDLSKYKSELGDVLRDIKSHKLTAAGGRNAIAGLKNYYGTGRLRGAKAYATE